MQRANFRDRRQAGPKNNGLRRSIAYLSRLRWQAVLPYLFLIVATMSQLAVPRLVRNIIDAVTRGVLANAIVPRLDEIVARASGPCCVVILVNSPAMRSNASPHDMGFHVPPLRNSGVLRRSGAWTYVQPNRPFMQA